jgi:hypothetical protein
MVELPRLGWSMRSPNDCKELQRETVLALHRLAGRAAGPDRKIDKQSNVVLALGHR